jgi:hypothetical protein
MLDFPANPTSGDLYGSWFWDGEKWMSTNAPAAVRASDTPPPNPKPGDLWFDTVGLALYVRYDDGTSVQWVVTINQPTLPDALLDGNLYGRKDGAWSQVQHTDIQDWTASLAPYAPYDWVNANFLPLFGGTVTGGIGCDAGSQNEIAFRVSTNGVMRWYWGKNAQVETGGETGSAYFLASCYDAGGYKATAFTVARTDMTVSFSYPIYNPSTRAGKQNIAPLTEALPSVLLLEGIAYDADNGERYLGLVAEDVQKVIPEIVAERSIGPNDEAMLCISYQQMVPVLIEAIKTLTARIEALENK